MKKIVYLARHGETDWNRLGRWQGHTDVALSAAGREQAALLGERLRGFTIGRIHSSDLSRAKETAEIVGRTLGVAGVAVDPGFRERAFGMFEGLTREECAVRFPDEWTLYREDPTRIPLGGEPHDQVIARMGESVRRACAGDVPDGAAILIVSHGGSIRALLSSVLGKTLPPMANGELYRLSLMGADFVDIASLG